MFTFSTEAGRIERVVRVGFEVRVHVDVAGESVLVTLTRGQFQSMHLEVGDIVWLRPFEGAPTVAADTPSLATTR